MKNYYPYIPLIGFIIVISDAEKYVNKSVFKFILSSAIQGIYIVIMCQ